uniref:NADH-ubiquinone oxidoreductase chain 4 n=1 Tax=Bugula neritina TaxID=10212 RepID=A9UKA4_BUGNE|nr:NADH dehydrogenase subunit 4 [Bugula neritina]AAT79562.1 NADH dehydrogenase subunit 4 [Bugula neritina]
MSILTVIILLILSFTAQMMSSKKMTPIIWLLTFSLLITTTKLWKTFSTYSWTSSMCSSSNFSIAMTLISIWITMMTVLVSTKYSYMNKNFNNFTYLLTSLLIITTIFFITDNLLMMYITFEASLIPTLILIIKWGYQPERLKSSFYFMMYTICASLPLLIMITKMNKTLFSMSMMTNTPLYLTQSMSMQTLKISALMLAFLVKTPMWTVHLWLPKAHVEAPVSGSMILAGILLKLGGWGLIQITKMSFKIMSNMKNLFYSINLWGTMMVGLICLSSVDLKMLIAYSSVIHMNMMILGIMSNPNLGVLGAMIMMIAHGISSPGMFAMANVSYEMTNTRNLMMQKGVMMTQPKMLFFWFLLAAANMAAPPSMNLASEILIYTSMMKVAFGFFSIAIMTTLISGAYNLYLFSSQKGNPSKLTLPNKKISSNHMTFLSSLSIPVFVITLSLYQLNL